VLWPSGQVANLTLTGQPVPLSGPSVTSGTMVASKLMPNGSIEVTETRNGKPLVRIVHSVSPDGRTTSYTTTRLDESSPKPSTYVFVKQ